MRLVLRESSKNIVFTAAATSTNVSIAIYHEYGDVVKATTLVSAGPATSFTYALTSTDTKSAGVHKVVWSYTQGSVSFTTTDYFKVYSPYTNNSTFFLAYPEVETDSNVDNFDAFERAARKTIDQYCQQEFQCIYAKTLKYDGCDKNTLATHLRLYDLVSVLRNGEDDITANVEISPESKFYLRKKRPSSTGTVLSDPPSWEDDDNRYFKSNATYWILSSYGWPYVPQDIEDAANILIADAMNQDSAYRKHGISFQGTGPIQTRLDPDLFGTTGNLDADVLLMDYSRLTLEYV